MPILATKLHIPPLRPEHVARPRLTDRLDESADRKLTLLSAAAGFGKTMVACEWIARKRHQRHVVWLSLDEDDNDPVRFLSYLIAALQQIEGDIGQAVARMLQTPQPPAINTCLTLLLNDIAEISDAFTLVLDDYHLITLKAIDQAMSFLIENAPPTMHVLMLSREDPPLPLHRLRAQGQLAELRATELRFTHAEAAAFLNQAMGLSLTESNIAALEHRTEGWIAGLQLAALSIQGQADANAFIHSFTGSHRFVMDYLVEEVLHQQPETIQRFLVHTAILDRMCGPLCEAVLGDSAVNGQATLEHLEQANLFIVPLDNERRWYRYHHLFAELLRQRLQQQAKGHMRERYATASQWCEDNDLIFEAFHYAAAGQDVERAERLIDHKGMAIHLRGAVMAILRWLDSLPPERLNAKPRLLWRHASLLLVNGHTTGVEEKLNLAERAINHGAAARDDSLIGHIAAARATLALTRYQPDTMIEQSQRALAHLAPTLLSARANAHWTMGYAHLLRGERVAARQAMSEAIALSKAANAPFTLILSTIGMGNVQEQDNELHPAAETYRQVLALGSEQPMQIMCEAQLGLARVLYEWNDLVGAQRHGQQGNTLARQYESVIDRFIVCEVFLARVQLAQGDLAGAVQRLTQTEQEARQRHFLHRIPEIAAAQVQAFLQQGNVAAAAALAAALAAAQTAALAASLAQTQSIALSFSQARVKLAQNDPTAALPILNALREQAEAKAWMDEQLKIKVLRAVALSAQGDQVQALQWLGAALAQAEPQGFIRLFVDEGAAMARLLFALQERGEMPVYVGKLLAAFEATPTPASARNSSTPLIEALSQREQEVLQLIAQGLSNRDIGERLSLALDTVKGHNRKIFEKLQVQRRTEAVATARNLGLV